MTRRECVTERIVPEGVRWLGLLCFLSTVAMAEPAWTPQRTSVGASVGGRWTKAVRVGGSGRAYEVSGAGPAVGFAGSFGWNHGALRLGGIASYEFMIDPEWDLSVAAGSPLGGLSSTNLDVRSAHFISAGPFVGARAGDGTLEGFADVAVLADVMAAELDEAGTRFALRFIPTARVGGSVDMGFASFELWLYGSALVTPRVGFCFALGF